MDILFSAISVIFIALIVAAAVTFGFIILVWVMVAAFVFSLLMYVRTMWRRWRFVHGNAPPKQPRSRQAPKIIDAEYTDVSDITDVK